MSEQLDDKQPKQPAEVVDYWVRLVMFHQRKSQGEVAEVLGVKSNTLSNWVQGKAAPMTDVLLRLWAHGKEDWVRLMAYQVLGASMPEVFADCDICTLTVDTMKLETQSAETLLGVSAL